MRPEHLFDEADDLRAEAEDMEEEAGELNGRACALRKKARRLDARAEAIEEAAVCGDDDLDDDDLDDDDGPWGSVAPGRRAGGDVEPTNGLPPFPPPRLKR